MKTCLRLRAFAVRRLRFVGKLLKFRAVDLPDGIEFYKHMLIRNDLVKFTGSSRGVYYDTKNKFLLKPIQKPPQGERELEFYAKIWEFQPESDEISMCPIQSVDDPKILEDLKMLQNFVTRYHGTQQLCINGKDMNCMKLEDLAAPFEHPNILDVKISSQTWDPGVSPAWQQYKRKIYPETLQNLGFLIEGYQTFNETTKKWFRNDDRYAMGQSYKTIRSAFKNYFGVHTNKNQSLRIMKDLIKRLYQIRSWFANQTTYHFYSSSILLIYGHLKPAYQSCENYKLEKTSSKVIHKTESEKLRSKNLHKSHGSNGQANLSSTISGLNNSEAQEMKSGRNSSSMSRHKAKLETVLKPKSKPDRLSSGGILITDPDAINLDLQTDCKTVDPNTTVVISKQESMTITSSHCDVPVRNCNAAPYKPSKMNQSPPTTSSSKTESVDSLNNFAVTAHMIDFAHVFEMNRKDEGYIRGLDNLILILNEIRNNVKHDWLNSTLDDP